MTFLDRLFMHVVKRAALFFWFCKQLKCKTYFSLVTF